MKSPHIHNVLIAPRQLCTVAMATLLMLMGVSVMPCAHADSFLDDARVQVHDLPTGLSVMPVAGSLRAIFKANDGAFIAIEALDVGPTSPEILAASPDTPSRQVDLRVLDGDGLPFIMGAAGDALAEPTWRQPVPENAINPQRRDRDFALFLAAVAGLTRPGAVGPEHADAVNLLANVARTVSLARTRDPLSSEAGGDAITFTHTIVVTWKWFGGPLGHHSATFASSKASTGQVVDFRYSCNHGTCAPSMSNVSCARALGGRSNAALKFPGHAGSETCPTSYGIYPSGNYHVCNDDSYVQVQSVVNNTYTGYWTCYYPPIRQYAPGCW